MKKRFTTYLNSPIGFLEISGTQTFVTSVLFVPEEEPSSVPVPEVLLQCKKELEEYFAGKRKKFDVKLKPEGTDFQRKVWSELKKLQYGDTTSYIEIAKQLKNPGSVRAVGHANGKNPIAVIIPCHRVISGDGKLTGYSGGMWRKQWLLEHEGNVSGKNRTLF
jgi:methylated-DNA-[protein]-cysteine S-methyltransferase